MKVQLEEATNKRFAIYKAILYSMQVVAGMNYFVKVSGWNHWIPQIPSGGGGKSAS